MQRSLRLHDSASVLSMPKQSRQGGSGRTSARSDLDATFGCDGRVSALSSADRARSRPASRVRQPIAGSGRQIEVLMSHSSPCVRRSTEYDSDGRLAFIEMRLIVYLTWVSKLWNGTLPSGFDTGGRLQRRIVDKRSARVRLQGKVQLQFRRY